LKKHTKKNIINIIGISLMGLFVIGMLYLVIFDDPKVVQEYDTKDPNTKMVVVTHTKTGEKDYFYEVRDGVGNIDPRDP
jgi:hypothetical protein